MPTISQLRACHDADMNQIGGLLGLPKVDREHKRRMDRDRAKSGLRKTWAEQKAAERYELETAAYRQAVFHA